MGLNRVVAEIQGNGEFDFLCDLLRFSENFWGVLEKLVHCWKIRNFINLKPTNKMRFCGQRGRQTASDLTSDLKFMAKTTYATMFVWAALDFFWTFIKNKNEFVSTRVVGFAATNNTHSLVSFSSKLSRCWQCQVLQLSFAGPGICPQEK